MDPSLSQSSGWEVGKLCPGASSAYGIQRHGVQEGKGRQTDKGRGMESRGWDRDNTGGEN